jgi:AcrR family transcriptional regulator
MKPSSQHSRIADDCRYHHGNLRQALVAAAVAHIRRHGAASFSLRDASTEAGVSSGAAYRHFKNRQEVLTEVVVLGFSELAMLTAKKVQRSCDAKRRVVATGLAYLAFAQQERHIFALMFGPEGATGRADALKLSEKAAVPSASVQLRAAIAELQGHEPDETTVMHAWGLAHGLAALAASGATDQPFALFERIFSNFADQCARSGNTQGC